MKIYNWRVGNLWVDLSFITANFAKVKLEEVFITPEDLKSKEWKAKSLTGKTPMLETPDGNLVESSAIARYIASIGEGKLAGATAFETAQVNQWIDYSHTTLQSQMYNILRGVFGYGEPDIDSDVFNNSVKEVKEIVKVINLQLQGKKNLVGERVTVADIAIAIQLIPLFQTVLDGGFRKAMPNVTAWLEGLVKLPEFVSRIGNVKFSQKALKPLVSEKKEEVKAAPVKPAAKPAPKENDDDDEVEKKPAGKNPLDNLPPSKFVLPEFKTYFVNLGDKKEPEGIPHFFENYDPEGYSLWFSHYDKYDGEGVLLYQTSNLMNGFLQRMDDKFRNYCFAMMAILGDEPNLEIEAVWLFRGKTIPQEMLDHPQFEYYQRRELDIKNEADKKIITEFFCAKSDVTTINGAKVQECKMFK
jgi:elongation factor 1-gamma